LGNNWHTGLSSHRNNLVAVIEKERLRVYEQRTDMLLSKACKAFLDIAFVARCADDQF
jgi:hypothetical protein